jgi:hypothetical protein
MSTDDKARKAAEENARTTWEPYTSDQTKRESVKDFLDGVAWARANPEWVHVNDKWPEPETMVLVYIPDAAEWQRIRTTIRVQPEGKHNGLVAQWAGAAIGVTHWHALPPAPEGE